MTEHTHARTPPDPGRGIRARLRAAPVPSFLYAVLAVGTLGSLWDQAGYGIEALLIRPDQTLTGLGFLLLAWASRTLKGELFVRDLRRPITAVFGGAPDARPMSRSEVVCLLLGLGCLCASLALRLAN